MAECFGCKHLKFEESPEMAIGEWSCHASGKIVVVGSVGDGLLGRRCEPPKQVCNGEYYP